MYLDENTVRGNNKQYVSILQSFQALELQARRLKQGLLKYEVRVSIKWTLLEKLLLILIELLKYEH